MKKQKTYAAIVAQPTPNKQSKGRSPQAQYCQIPLFNTPQPTREYPLTIEVLPDNLQWWDETRYWLVHKESGLRVPGSFSETEARKIQEVSKDWDWSVDTRDRKVACGLNLLSLAEIVCNRHRSTTSKKEKRGVTRIGEALKLAKGGES